MDSDDPKADHESAAVMASRLLARNVRLNGELARDVRGKSWRLSTGLVTAF